MSPAGSYAQPSSSYEDQVLAHAAGGSATARALVVTGASAPPRRTVSEYLAVAWPLNHAASGCVLTRDLVTPSQSATALRAMRSCVETTADTSAAPRQTRSDGRTVAAVHYFTQPVAAR